MITKSQASELVHGLYPYGFPGWWGTKQKPKFWRNPMKWLRDRLWNWISSDRLASDYNIETRKLVSDKSTRLGNRVAHLEYIEAEYEAQEETAFDDEVLTETFARLQRQTDIVNARTSLTLSENLVLARRLSSVEEKAGGAGAAVKSAHGRIDNIVGREHKRAESLKQMDLDFSDITTSLCVENARLKDQLDVIGRRVTAHEILFTHDDTVDPETSQ